MLSRLTSAVLLRNVTEVFEDNRSLQYSGSSKGIPGNFQHTLLSLLQRTFSLRQPEISPMLSDRPNRHNQALAVQGGKLILHAKDCALSTFDRAFIQQPERARKLRPGICGLLDFHGMKLSVHFHDDVDFLGVVITVIEKVVLKNSILLSFYA